MPNEKLFTKSAFKVALECPWKLFYYRNSDKFTNNNEGNEFLEALAEGGFQVGELAKIYEKVDVDLKNVVGYEESVKRTSELLKRENVTIAEAAFRWGNMFVRVDILEKRGNRIKVIEVKAKSWHPENSFISNRPKGSVASKIRAYVYDVAFQKYVVSNALPDCKVEASLMMADKSKCADFDGLNKLFKISKDENGKVVVKVDGKAREIIDNSKEKLLTAFDKVDTVCDDIIEGRTTEQTDAHFMQGLGFKEFVKRACDCYCNDRPYSDVPELCGTCFKCEFCDSDHKEKSGKRRCWLTKITGDDFDTKPLVDELNGSDLGPKRGEWVREGKYFMKDVTEEMVLPKEMKSDDKPGLKNYERKVLQIGLTTGNEGMLEQFKGGLKGKTYLDVKELTKEMEHWKFPLHMIDFETTAVALPYYKGIRPYEQVAFQFSHHIIHKDGKIEHKGQYLNEKVNDFPNFNFVRRLKEELEEDKGTIFRYANHENSILCAIHKQLEESNEADKKELMKFIEDITHKKDEKNKVIWSGPRDMVDLLDVVKRYYYNQEKMQGSNSIKKVLPAVLNSSKFLQEKYSKAIYGSVIPSRNIKASEPIAWIKFKKNGDFDSPYHNLVPVSNLIGMSEAEMEKMEELTMPKDEFTVADGGAALTAYNKLLFYDGESEMMSEALRKALLRYCELDTMSMVFIWEYFKDECNNSFQL